MGSESARIGAAELEGQVPPHAEHDDLLVKVPPLEKILRRRRFDHPGRYGGLPASSSVCTRTVGESLAGGKARPYHTLLQYHTLEAKPRPTGDCIRVITIPAKLAVIVDVGRYRRGPVRCHSGTDDRAVVFFVRSDEGVRGIWLTGKSRYDRQNAVLVFMFPGRLQCRLN